MAEVAHRSEPGKSTLNLFTSSVWLPIFTAVTLIGLIVPIFPIMPRGGLDPSWMLAMNDAVAQHMRIGHDVVFTFGPYAALYTQLYHPVLDHLMLFSGMIFALCYVGAALYLGGEKRRGEVLILVIFLGWFMQSRDALFFSYPLLLALCAVKFCTDRLEDERFEPGKLVFAAALCVPLGLLPLVKGNMIALCGIMIVLMAVYLLSCKRIAMTVAVIMVPVASFLSFWIMAKQPMNGLADYGANSSQILAGYTEAMGTASELRGLLGYLPAFEVIAYLLIAGAFMWSLMRIQTVQGASKGLIFLSFALFLFVGFKSGYVRHDAHALIAANSLLFACILIGFWGWNRNVKRLFAASVLLCLFAVVRYNAQVVTLAKALLPHAKTHITQQAEVQAEAKLSVDQPETASGLIRGAVLGVYGKVLEGLWIRLFHPGGLTNAYHASVAKIASEYPIARLGGSLDIYPLGQAYALASENTWNPRPVIQSYAAWTPKLILLNEQHLRTQNAPDHILFGLFSLDHHLPSLEDGISWSAFLDNYTVDATDMYFTLLNRRPVVQTHSGLTVLKEGVYRTGDRVDIPSTGKPLFAMIDLEPTFLGKLANTIFKPTQVRILLNLSDGTVRDYRVLPNMMKSGFLVSPVVEDTSEFSELISGNASSLSHVFVKKMVILPYHPGLKIWQDHYVLKLEEYRGGAWDSPVR